MEELGGCGSRRGGASRSTDSSWQPSGTGRQQCSGAAGDAARAAPAFAEYAGPSALRQHCSGLHVHVGVASPEECMGRLEAVLPWLPLVLALSANSPYAAARRPGSPLRGRSCSSCCRAPGAAAVRRLRGLGALRRAARRARARRRPHAPLVGRAAAPAPGTLEIRAPDQPPARGHRRRSPELAQALVAGPTRPARPTAASTPRTAGRPRASARRRARPPGGRRLCCSRCSPSSWARERRRARRGFLASSVGLDQAGEQLEAGARNGLEPVASA